MDETPTQRLIRISTAVFLFATGLLMSLIGLPFALSFDFKISTVGLSLVACGVYLLYQAYITLLPSKY